MSVDAPSCAKCSTLMRISKEDEHYYLCPNCGAGCQAWAVDLKSVTVPGPTWLAILRLLRYSWRDIGYYYTGLTPAEKECIDLSDFKAVLGAMQSQGLNHRAGDQPVTVSFLRPAYHRGVFALLPLQELLDAVPWQRRTEARSECFMSDEPHSYTYGKGPGERTYTSIAPCAQVDAVLRLLNLTVGRRFNACFLNRYDTQHEQLGWHSDDSPGQDHGHPIAVVSFGAERDIWWRPAGQLGVVPREQRQLLEHGSLFVMPGGFQQDFQHRIPKADKPVGVRASMTFRSFS